MSKTVHQIEIRDDVWRRVEALAQRRGVSPDEIVQAALVQLFSRKKPTQPPSAVPTEAVRAAPPRPSGPPPPAPSRRPPPPSGSAARRPPPPSGSAARSLPKPGSGARPLPKPAARAVVQPLYLWCEGAWYAVDQDEFVIGRHQKYSDLAIRDANISRRHVAIVRRNGAYYMTDLGSTNGVEFNGQRVDNHLISEGSTYYLCDHELRFTFNAPA